MAIAADDRPAAGADRRLVLTVNGAPVVAYERGDGEPCLLLHGYPQDHRIWRHIAGPLSERHRLVAVDWPGWGESVGSRDLGARYDDEVERIGRILDALDIRRANVIAHDYGAHVALCFAARHGERVARLAIFNSRAHATFPILWYVQFSAMSVMARTPGLDRLLAAMPLFAIHRRSLARYVRNGSFTADERDAYIDWMRTPAGRGFFVRFFRDYETAIRRGMRDECRRIEAATAVIFGDADPWCPFAVAEDLAAVIPGAALTRIAGGDHYIVEERPAECLRALEALLTRPVRS